MNTFPLLEFLTTLESDDFRLTVRDYDRIAIALSTGSEWTILRLRSMLLSMLAKSEEQREIFLRRFNEFFDVEVHASGRGVVDVDRVLEELKGVRDEPETEVVEVEKPRRHYEKLLNDRTLTSNDKEIAHREDLEKKSETA